MVAMTMIVMVAITVPLVAKLVAVLAIGLGVLVEKSQPKRAVEAACATHFPVRHLQTPILPERSRRHGLC